MNPREEQDLRAEIADAVEDKCLYMGVCPNTLNTILGKINFISVTKQTIK